MKWQYFERTFVLLLTLAICPACQNSKPVSPTPAETQRLYSLPPSILLRKGEVLHTTDGDVILQSDQRLYSQGAFMEQVERAIRSQP